MSKLKVGDKVEVIDEGLKMLRDLCPGMPPNHHGNIASIDGETVIVAFPIGNDGKHLQFAPYHSSKVRKRASHA